MTRRTFLGGGERRSFCLRAGRHRTASGQNAGALAWAGELRYLIELRSDSLRVRVGLQALPKAPRKRVVALLHVDAAPREARLLLDTCARSVEHDAVDDLSLAACKRASSHPRASGSMHRESAGAPRTLAAELGFVMAIGTLATVLAAAADALSTPRIPLHRTPTHIAHHPARHRHCLVQPQPPQHNP